MFSLHVSVEYSDTVCYLKSNHSGTGSQCLSLIHIKCFFPMKFIFTQKYFATTLSETNQVEYKSISTWISKIITQSSYRIRKIIETYWQCTNYITLGKDLQWRVITAFGRHQSCNAIVIPFVTMFRFRDHVQRTNFVTTKNEWYNDFSIFQIKFSMMKTCDLVIFALIRSNLTEFHVSDLREKL